MKPLLVFEEDATIDNHDMMVRFIRGDDWAEYHKKHDYDTYKVERSADKDIFLGLCYGEGGPTMCRELGKSTQWALVTGWGRSECYETFGTRQEAYHARAERGEGYIREIAGDEGQAILDKFDQEVPFVRMLAKSAKKRAQSKGYVRTILNRRLHFPQQG